MYRRSQSLRAGGHKKQVQVKSKEVLTESGRLHTHHSRLVRPGQRWPATLDQVNLLVVLATNFRGAGIKELVRLQVADAKVVCHLCVLLVVVLCDAPRAAFQRLSVNLKGHKCI